MGNPFKRTNPFRKPKEEDSFDGILDRLVVYKGEVHDMNEDKYYPNDRNDDIPF